MKLDIDPDWVINMAKAEDSVGGLFAAGFLVNTNSQWLWRMNWCERYEIPPAESWAWELSGTAFDIHRVCIGRTIYDAESAHYGLVVDARVIPHGLRLQKTKLTVDWDDGTRSRGLDLRALHY